MSTLIGCLLACAVALSGAAQSTVAAQEEELDRRLERVAGIRSEAAVTFFDDLRTRVGTSDTRAVCAMIAYPLKQPSGDVVDAAACQARYDELFTIPVRRAVGRQQYQDLFVSTAGVAIGVGELWFAARCGQPPCALGDVRITAVHNMPGLQPPAGKVLIACNVAGQAVRVTADGSGGAALRIWRSHTPSGTPMVELQKGTPTPQAAGLCSWRAWSFTDPTSTYTVAEVGCMANPVPAPMGTVARVGRRIPAGEDEGWCFE